MDLPIIIIVLMPANFHGESYSGFFIVLVDFPGYYGYLHALSYHL